MITYRSGVGWLLVSMFAVAIAYAAPAATEEPAGSKQPATKKKPRPVVGRIEHVLIRDVDLQLKARIDTGAGVSSIHAKILEFSKTPDGQERVKFEITDAAGESKTLERDVVGWMNIKVMGSDEKHRRPIVKLHICLGKKKLFVRVNLNDRSNYLYPMLAGRNLLNTGKFLVDPSQRYLAEPDCDGSK